MKFISFISKFIRGKKRATCVFLSGFIIEKNSLYFSTRLDALSDGDCHHA